MKSFRQLSEDLEQLSEASGRNTLYHATGEEGAEGIRIDKAFDISDSSDIDDYFDDDDDDDPYISNPYISFARNRGSDYRARGVRDIAVIYEFDREVLRRNTKREGASFEPYDFWEIDSGDSRWRGGRNNINRGGSRKAHGSSEMEERLWFDTNKSQSKGVYNSIDTIHVVFKNTNMRARDLERFLNAIEIDGVDTLFYMNRRDWIQGKAFFDPFDILREEVEINEAVGGAVMLTAALVAMLGVPLTGLYNALSSTGDNIRGFWDELPKQLPKMTSVLAGAGVSAYSIKKFSDYLLRLRGMNNVEVRRERDVQTIIVNALDFAGIPPDILVSKKDIRRARRSR